ncbi:MAG TPA: hypothetical protein VIZ22_03695 [Candidatus Limnocylindrales bacterium]
MNPDETLDEPVKGRVRDSSDVLEGEIGNARIKEPTDDPETGADLTELPEIRDVPSEGTENDRAARGGSV